VSILLPCRRAGTVTGVPDDPTTAATVATVDDDGMVVLSDPRAVRALAHPARLAVIEALFSGEVLTATQCAQLAGVSPSAMSYHLRALEKFGLVRRAAAGPDGRERPWAAAGASLRVDVTGGGRVALVATSLLIQQAMESDRELMARLVALAAEEPDNPWVPASNYGRHRLLVTAAEAKDLNQQLDALLEPYHLRNRTDAPDGAMPVLAAVLVAPELPTGRDEANDPDDAPPRS
jgi:DNA-binding transcriptional ArsR family regulator